MAPPRGTRLRPWLGAERHRAIGDVRGMGLMVGVELVRDRLTKEPAPEIALRVLDAAKRLSPPLIVTKADADAVVGILDEALAAAG